MKKSVIKRLQSIVGENNAYIEKDDLETFSIDGVVPELVLFPDNAEQVSEIMMLASKECLSVLPIGSGTKRDIGNKPEKADIVISTKNLNRIVEHAASDLVATAEAGIKLKEFQAELSKEKQQLALDPPHIDAGATIGGIIATNDSGPGRLRYGTAREFLIGIKVVQADGKIFKGGAKKVVKNVAGYDLPKLYVGSLGTLGIIVEATFRLYPIPECTETYIAGFSSLDNTHKAVMTLLDSDLVIGSLELLNPALTNAIATRNSLDIDENNYTLAIRISNVEKAVKDQMSTVMNIRDQNNGKGILVNENQEHKLWEDIRNFPWELVKNQRVVCKVSVLVTDTPRVLENIDKLSAENGITSYVSVRAGSGICALAIEGEVSSLLSTLSALSSFISQLGGHLVIQEAPLDIKSSIDVWGDIGSGKQIMRRIKNNFDPDNLLNPGRYI